MTPMPEAPLICRLLGHNMKPRFSVEPKMFTVSMPNHGFGGPTLYDEVHYKKTYEGDHCTRCPAQSTPQETADV